MSWRDATYLLDMLLAARNIRDFTADLTWDKFLADELRQFATCYCVQVLGHAAEKVSQPRKESLPDVRWDMLIDTGRQVIEEYDQVNWSRVREIVENDVDLLISQLEPIIPREDHL